MTVISNSQLNSYLKCSLLHNFQYHMKLRAKSVKTSLYRGIMGHNALEAFYLSIMEKDSYELAEKAAIKVLDEEILRVTIEDEIDRMPILVELKRLVKKYIHEVAILEQLKPIVVEDLITISINQELDLEFGFKADLVAELTKGPDRGSLVLLDHKFKYDFLSVDQLAQDGQLPRYMEALKRKGYPVIKAFYNVLRYRKIKEPTTADLFRRQPVDLTRAYRKSVWSVTEQAVLEIHTNPRQPIPILNSYECGRCDFLLPCKRKLAGEDITQILRANFEPRKSPLDGEVDEDAAT